MFEENQRWQYQSVSFDERQYGRREPVRRFGAVAISIPATMAPSSRAFDHGSAGANPPYDGIPRTPLAAIRRVTTTIRLWRQNARMRQELHELSDHMLKDIGLRRENLGHEPVIPFLPDY